MKVSIDMPTLSEEAENRIAEWLKGVGDSVRRGEPIAVIETDKASLELEALQSGTIVEIVHGAGAEVAVGTTIAYLETD
jgi:pyruvate/2-oxoglutarate dehydrogenase complex dihydrolipoamide acyltransferase (E2) component